MSLKDLIVATINKLITVIEAQNLQKQQINLLSRRVTIADTRNENYAPSWYWANHPQSTVKEFKRLSALKIPNSFGNYGLLITEVPWRDASGGRIEQKITDNTGRIWRRMSDTAHTYASGAYTYTKDNWSDWIADVNQNELQSLKAEFESYKATHP